MRQTSGAADFRFAKIDLGKDGADQYCGLAPYWSFCDLFGLTCNCRCYVPPSRLAKVFIRNDLAYWVLPAVRFPRPFPPIVKLPLAHKTVFLFVEIGNFVIDDLLAK